MFKPNKTKIDISIPLTSFFIVAKPKERSDRCNARSYFTAVRSTKKLSYLSISVHFFSRNGETINAGRDNMYQITRIYFEKHCTRV
jgi:hypothetical protein